MTVKQRIPTLDEFINESEKSKISISDIEEIVRHTDTEDNIELANKIAILLSKSRKQDEILSIVKKWCPLENDISNLAKLIFDDLIKHKILSKSRVLYEGKSLSFMESDSYYFIGNKSDKKNRVEWEKLLKILKNPQYKKYVIDISYSEWQIGFEKDTDLSFIPKNLLTKLEKQDD